MKRVLKTYAQYCQPQVVLLVITTFSMSLYWIIVNNQLFSAVLTSVLAGDIAPYLIRLVSITLLLGALPLLTARMLGFRISDLGIRRPTAKIAPYMIVGVPCMILVGIGGSINPGMVNFYPFSKTIASYAADNILWLLLHALLYMLFYYIPWECCFRGVLLFPFVERSTVNSGHAPPAALFFQVVPSTMLHFGHPLPELLGAIPFGIVAGYIAWRCQSLIPVWILHLTAGIALDGAIIYRVY